MVLYLAGILSAIMLVIRRYLVLTVVAFGVLLLTVIFFIFHCVVGLFFAVCY